MPSSWPIRDGRGRALPRVPSGKEVNLRPSAPPTARGGGVASARAFRSPVGRAVGVAGGRVRGGASVVSGGAGCGRRRGRGDGRSPGGCAGGRRRCPSPNPSEPEPERSRSRSPSARGRLSVQRRGGMLGKGVVGGGGGGARAPKPSFVSYVRPEVSGRRAAGRVGLLAAGRLGRAPRARAGRQVCARRPPPAQGPSRAGRRGPGSSRCGGPGRARRARNHPPPVPAPARLRPFGTGGPRGRRPDPEAAPGPGPRCGSVRTGPPRPVQGHPTTPRQDQPPRGLAPGPRPTPGSASSAHGLSPDPDPDPPGPGPRACHFGGVLSSLYSWFRAAGGVRCAADCPPAPQQPADVRPLSVTHTHTPTHPPRLRTLSAAPCPPPLLAFFPLGIFLQRVHSFVPERFLVFFSSPLASTPCHGLLF